MIKIELEENEGALVFKNEIVTPVYSEKYSQMPVTFWPVNIWMLHAIMYWLEQNQPRLLDELKKMVADDLKQTGRNLVGDGLDYNA